MLSRLTQAKYHRITRKNSAYWQINTTRRFSYTRLIQVPGCSATWTADQHRARFHTRIGPGQSSPAILLSPNLFDS